MSLNKIHAEIIGEGKPVLFLPSADFTGNQGQQLANWRKDMLFIYLIFQDLVKVMESRSQFL
jgi:2-hydroxy-6-oxonona-2,4-dienedioate hydrolase